MNVKNKKADSSPVVMVGGVVMILLIGVVILATSSATAQYSVGAIAKAQCKSSIELKNKVNQQIDNAKNNAKNNLDDAVWGKCGWLRGACRFGAGVFSLGVTEGVYVTAQAGIDKGADTVKLRTDLCIENTQETCPIVLGDKYATADLAAECAYKRAVDTYYVFQGGRSGKRENFNLYELNINVDGLPNGVSSVSVAGSCSKYLAPNAIWDDNKFKGVNIGDDRCDAVVKRNVQGNYACGWQQTANICNISFSRVTEDTMTLTMISRCQQEGSGPDQQQYCRCFANPDVGYNTNNGLPNGMIFNKDIAFFNIFEVEGGAQYTTLLDGKSYPIYNKFSGCGIDSASRNGIKVGSATIKFDNIDGRALNVLPSDQKTYYLRLVNGKVVFSENKK